jgi:hypothetical protein
MAPAPTAASSPMSAPVNGNDDEPLTIADVWATAPLPEVVDGVTDVAFTVGGTHPV